MEDVSVPPGPMSQASTQMITGVEPQATPRTGLEHTFSIEQNGISMRQLVDAMKCDAQKQEQLLDVIACVLDCTVARNDSNGRKTDMAAFEGSYAPIAASAYVRRINRYGGCSACCFAVGLMYLERLKRRNHTVCLNSCNFQRLYLVAVMTAAKFLDDFYYSNKHWAEVGGISLQELNLLELEFLFRMGFCLNITREDYESYFTMLVGNGAPVAQSQAACTQGKKEDGMGSKALSWCDVTNAISSMAQ
eukprot:768564-Hanusia_phi.AAC.10